ncbi:MAG: hypothetical protein F4Z30_02330 [Gemmatimonadetes bacterium]|nr:hypothetical protein [Gemmatimonadota bacterium]
MRWTQRSLYQPILVVLLDFPKILEEGVQIAIGLLCKDLPSFADFYYNRIFIHGQLPLSP